MTDYTRSEFLNVYKQDPQHEVTQTAAPINEGIYTAMYGQDAPVSDRPRPQIPGLLPDQTLSMHVLLKMILDLQTQVAENDRLLRKLSQQVQSMRRGARSHDREMEAMSRELERKVTQRSQ